MQPTISPAELHARLREGTAQILDVRTPAEFAAAHISGGQLLPLDVLESNQFVGTAGFDKGKPLYLVCQSGTRARKAATRLAEAGFTQCFIAEGGIAAWEQQGLPLERTGSKVISLERQVRIAAGTLVLLGVLLAVFVHFDFIWISGLIGAGLVFAGVTDWCGMGRLLARMPWNQRTS